MPLLSGEPSSGRVQNCQWSFGVQGVHICFDFLRLLCDQIRLTFQKNILDLVNEFPEKIACSFHVTKQITQISADLRPYITGESPKRYFDCLHAITVWMYQLVECKCFIVGSFWLGMSLPGRLRDDSSWKHKERLVVFTYYIQISCCLY